MSICLLAGGSLCSGGLLAAPRKVPAPKAAARMAQAPSPAPASTPTPAPAEAADFAYTVKTGDNPWNLTNRFLRDLSHWQRLVAYNRISDDKHIAPGTVLQIPVAWLKFASTSVRVLSATGEVEVDQGQGWTRLTSALELADGHKLRTRQGGAALALGDGSVLRVRPETELNVVSIGRLVANGALWLRVELLHGDLDSDVHDLKKSGGRFDVLTPSAVTSVRGTVFRVSAAPDSTRTEVVDGRVALGNAQGEVMLPTATGSRAERGQVPQPPRPLLPAPVLDARLQAPIITPIDLTRPPLEGARRFRTQVLSAADNTSAPIHEAVAESLTLPALPPGRYLVQVRGIDADGFEGQDRRQPIEVVSAPPPPPPAPPEVPSWTRVEPGRVLQLGWTSLGPDRLYQVQVLQASAGAPVIVLDEYVRGEALTLPPPPPGQYRIQVRLAPSVGREPAWSAAAPIAGRSASTAGAWAPWWSSAR